MKKRVKKVIMAAAVLYLGLLLWISCIPSGETGAYFMLGPYGVEPSTYYEVYFPNEDFMPSSSSEETGAYFMPGPFSRMPWKCFSIQYLEEYIQESLHPKLPYEEGEKILDELTEFCNGHREKLNEMSEYFINALENTSDYKDHENLPDIEELAGAFKDEESRGILEKLDPYYPYGIDSGSGDKWVSYHYPYDYGDKYVSPKFMVVYIQADEEELTDILDANSYYGGYYYGDYGWTTRRIDKYLFAVMEGWLPNIEYW